MVVEALAHGPLGVQVLELGADLAVLLNLALNLKKKYLLKVKIFLQVSHFCVCVSETAVWRGGGMRGEASHCLVH